MRFGKYAAVIATASFYASTLAAPVLPGDKLVLGQREEEKKSDEDKSKNKYFHEPGGNYQLGHYDARYFHGVVSDEERTDTQYHMIRSYLQFFEDQNLDTWIAHGTLLGWWWNGKRLPWDFDMDTQVTGATLQYLGENHNQSRHKYTAEDGRVQREFLLDVNPWIWERERGDGMNIIDARWIDTRNGLFIDITGLSETHPDTNPGVWSCKNYHRYKTTELYPMRETLFEGLPAKVPYSYDKILVDEYKEKALVDTEFQGHAWDPSQKEWIKTPEQIEKERKEAEEKERKKQEEEQKQKQKQAEEEAKKQSEASTDQRSV